MKRIIVGILVVLAAALASPGAQAQSRSRTFVFSDAAGGARLGVSLQDVTPRLKEKQKLAVKDGAYVSGVAEDSPAEKAGIEEGDVVVSFHGTPVDDADALIRAVKKAPSGEPVEIVVDRNGDRKTLSVKLRKRSSSYSYSFGPGHAFTVPPVPAMPRVRTPRAFGLSLTASERIEGMQVQKLSRQLAEYFEVPNGKGLLVTEVEKRSAAADAGIKAGDVIVKVNSSAVGEADDLRDVLSDQDEKGGTQLEIVRRGKPQTVTLKIESEDEDGDDDADSDDVSFDAGIPHVIAPAHAAARASIADANKEFLRELHETLSQMQERIREKMRRLQERITDKVLNL
jgi:S1-C subfamily serine protease